MSALEEALDGILKDPQKMQQLMRMAQMLGGTQEAGPPPQEARPPEPGPDPGLLQNLTGLLIQGGIDPHQQDLLNALSPYLSLNRLTRLERAMHAARMAGAASALLNSAGR